VFLDGPQIFLAVSVLSYPFHVTFDNFQAPLFLNMIFFRLVPRLHFLLRIHVISDDRSVTSLLDFEGIKERADIRAHL